MWKRFCFASALAMSLWFAFGVSGVSAKPSDLPYQHQIECEPDSDPPAQGKLQIELEITGKGVALKFNAGPAPVEEAPAIDAVLPPVAGSAPIQSCLRLRKLS